MTTFRGMDNTDNPPFFGDGDFTATHSVGGDDDLAGGDANQGHSASNILYGDWRRMAGNASGGDDYLFGGFAVGGSATNTLYGDAYDISGNAKGGDDTLIGGGANLMGGEASAYGAFIGAALPSFVIRNSGPLEPPLEAG